MPQEPSSRPQTPILDKITGRIDTRFLPSVGLGFGTRTGENTTLPNTRTGKKSISHLSLQTLSPRKKVRKLVAEWKRPDLTQINCWDGILVWYREWVCRLLQSLTSRQETRGQRLTFQ